MDLEKLQYFPLALPHFSLLALIFLVLVAWIEVQALRSAYLSMGLGPHAALILLLASLAGSYLNIPVARLSGEQIVSGQEVWYFGMRYVIPEVISRPGTVIAVNVGGAMIPGLLSIFPVRQKPIMDQRGYRYDSGGGGVPLACPSCSWPRHRASRFRPATFGSGYRLAAVAQGCGAACLYQRLARHANRS